MNTAGVEAERKTRRTIMSGLHGMWSVGVLAGALAGSLAARVGLDPRIQFAAMGVLIAVLSVRVCGVLGTAGCLLVAVAPDIGLAMLGFVLIGIGVSVVVPLVFAAAGHHRPDCSAARTPTLGRSPPPKARRRSA